MAEVVRRHEGPPRKSLDSDKNLKLLHTLFCRDIKIGRNFRTFWKILGKKVFYWVRNSISWARRALLHGIYCILHWINFASLQIHAKTTHLSRNYQICVRRKFLWPFLLSLKGCQLVLVLVHMGIIQCQWKHQLYITRILKNCNNLSYKILAEKVLFY